MLRVMIKSVYFPIIDCMAVKIDKYTNGQVYFILDDFFSVKNTYSELALVDITDREFQELEMSFKSFLSFNHSTGVFDFDVQIIGIRKFIENEPHMKVEEDKLQKEKERIKMA